MAGEYLKFFVFTGMTLDQALRWVLSPVKAGLVFRASAMLPQLAPPLSCPDITLPKLAGHGQEPGLPGQGTMDGGDMLSLLFFPGYF